MSQHGLCGDCRPSHWRLALVGGTGGVQGLVWEVGVSTLVWEVVVEWEGVTWEVGGYAGCRSGSREAAAAWEE